jgi:type VI secretion system protein ImpA
MVMALRDDIFEPIPGGKPCGEDLYNSPLFDEIREARKHESDDPQVDWEKLYKTTDYAGVIELGEEALATKTKDLRLAQWVAEALICARGFAGLEEAIKLFHGLIEKFWDQGLYPAIEEPEDAEYRAAALEWFGNYFAPDKGSSPCLAVRYVPLTRGGKGWMKYKESRAVPYENDKESKSAEARKLALAEGKMPPEEFDADFDQTPKPLYKQAAAHVKASRESLAALEKLCDDKFGQYAPSLRTMAKTLEEIDLSVTALLKKKLEQDPDPVPVPETVTAGEAGADGAAAGLAAPGVVVLKSSAELAALAPADGSEAVNRILAVAQYLRLQEPQSPVPYLILRALRWGELRARCNGGEGIDPGFLQAPAVDVRVSLKRHAAAANWRQVLETAEGAMGEPCGRGWLDLQRYSIQACQELGFTAAAAAMLSELKALLNDVPNLPGMTLSDDTGAANPQTMTWLTETVLAQSGG